MKIGPHDWEMGDLVGRPKPHVALGFSGDACDRCGAENVRTSWISVDNPSRSALLPERRWLSLHLCQDCLILALRRTYAGGQIDWRDLRRRADRARNTDDET